MTSVNKTPRAHLIKIFVLSFFIPSFALAKLDKSELQNLMDTYVNQVSRGSFSSIPHTDEFKAMLDIDKEKFKECAKAVCKVKFIKEPTAINMGGEETIRMNVQVLKGKNRVGEPDSCYFAIREDKKLKLDSFATDCDQ